MGSDPKTEAGVAADLAAITKAEQAVSDLCNQRIRWTMRVPAEPDRDPDLIISKALGIGRRAIEDEAARLVSPADREGLVRAIESALPMGAFRPLMAAHDIAERLYDAGLRLADPALDVPLDVGDATAAELARESGLDVERLAQAMVDCDASTEADAAHWAPRIAASYARGTEAPPRCLCGHDADPTGQLPRLDIVCPKHDAARLTEGSARDGR